MVADYANLNLFEVDDLDYVDYLTLRREAYIWALSKSEQGQKYLRDCWAYEQTEPDRSGLRNLMNMMGQS